MSDTKGQRCCEQGNFGELHDCAKGQPAESTASAFEEWWDENGIDYVPAGELGRPTAKELAQAGWQARGASEYERGRRDGLEQAAQLCEGRSMETGSWFADAIRSLAATSGTPAEHNSARAPHDKFASLWCDACPRPTSGTPAPQDELTEKEELEWSAFCDKEAERCFDTLLSDGKLTDKEYFSGYISGTIEDSFRIWRAKRVLTEMCPTCGEMYAIGVKCDLCNPAAPPPADETLPAGTCDNTISITIRGQEQVAIVMDALQKAGFVSGQSQAAPPSGAQGEGLAWLNERVYEGKGAYTFSLTESGNVGLFIGEKCLGAGDTADEALDAALAAAREPVVGVK